MTVVMTGGTRKITVIRGRGGSRPASCATEAGGHASRLDARVVESDGVKFVVIDRESGRTQRGAIVEDLGDARKQSKPLRPVEKQLRKALRNQLRTLSVYLTLHDRSNRKKKDGWLRDLGANMRKARRKPSWE